MWERLQAFWRESSLHAWQASITAQHSHELALVPTSSSCGTQAFCFPLSRPGKPVSSVKEGKELLSFRSDSH